MNERITIEIDIEPFREELKRQAIQKIVSDYFDANDISDWDRRKKEREIRMKKIMDEVDWNKLPEEMQKSVLREFIDKYVIRRN